MPKVWDIAKRGETRPYVDRFRIHPAIAQCLINRGLSVEQADRFMKVEEKFYDPFLLPDMNRAVTRLIKAKEKGEKVVVYRDYDVDGTMGGTILVKALSKFGINVSHFAPNRFRDGYGLHIHTLDRLIDEGAELIVTVDCGITSVEEVEHAKNRGVDIIVTDHHEPGERLPDAVAVINPKRKDSRYPYREICGAAVAWKLAKALLGEDCREFLDLVAVATIADVVPLLDENRVITRYGLERLNSDHRNLGIDKLAKVAGIKEIDSYAIGFGIGPRINAVGRLGDPNAILELFLTESQIKAERLATIADQINTKRQQLVDHLFELAESLLREQWNEKQNVIVLASDQFHEGVIGIVAARILEKYQRPTIVIALRDGIGKASCRSIHPLNMYESLTAVRDLLIQFGGHEMAAGFSIAPEKIEEFRHAINEVASPIDPTVFQAKVFVDAVIDLEEVDDYLVEQMNAMAPFGEGNPAPCFAVMQVKVTDWKLVSEGKHVQIGINDRVTRRAIGFNFGKWAEENLCDNLFVDIAFRPSFNEFAGQKTIQLEIMDIRKSEVQAEKRLEEAAELDSRALAAKLFGSEAQRTRFDEGKYDGIEKAPFFHTKVAGVSFDGRQEVIKTLNPGDILYFRREPEKFVDAQGVPLDPNAISVYTEKNEHVGFLNRRLAEVLAPIIDSGASYIGMVDSVTGDNENLKGLNIVVQRLHAELEGPTTKPDVEIAPKLLFLEEDDPLNSQAMMEIRKRLIGNYDYHPKQREAIEASIRGENIMVVMGTGRGKSAIFQSVAAYENLIRGKKTLIFYPIKALLNDQYYAMARKLSPLGIRVGVASGSLSPAEKEELFKEAFAYDILVATPEFVLYHQDRFREFLNHTGVIVLDECHHLADDRFGYRQISKLVEKIKHAKTILLSATIDNSVLRRIEEEFKIERVIIDDFSRENLEVVDCRDHTPKESVLYPLAESGEKVVVYCNSRMQTVLVAEKLRRHLMKVGRHNEVVYYNADLDGKTRTAIERAFASGDVRVIVATSAFGEGIDIPDIRHVVHYHLPLSLTAFVQQSGRAGRDGQDAKVYLLFGRLDERINQGIIDEMCPSKEVLIGLLKTLVQSAGKHGVVKLMNDEIQKLASNHLGMNVSHQAVETALRIFEDLGLIRSEWNKDRIIFVEPLKQVSLHDAVIYSEAVRDRRTYQDYVEWIRQAPVSEIQAVISRPLFPKLRADSA